MLDRVRRDLQYYLNEHENKYNRVCHYFAFMAAFIAWIIVWTDVRVAIGLAVLHYLLSWIGHFYYEGNKPASFRYPLVGFYAGFTWFFITTIEIVSRKNILHRWINKGSK